MNVPDDAGRERPVHVVGSACPELSPIWVKI